MSASSTQDVLDRLEILWRKLEDEGMYVQANTAYLAIEEIKRLRYLEQHEIRRLHHLEIDAGGKSPQDAQGGELLPCPYCGCSSIRDFEPFERRGHRIDCNCCNGGVTGPTRAEAVKKWNKRAAIDKASQQ